MSYLFLKSLVRLTNLPNLLVLEYLRAGWVRYLINSISIQVFHLLTVNLTSDVFLEISSTFFQMYHHTAIYKVIILFSKFWFSYFLLCILSLSLSPLPHASILWVALAIRYQFHYFHYFFIQLAFVHHLGFCSIFYIFLPLFLLLLSTSFFQEYLLYAVIC